MAYFGWAATRLSHRLLLAMSALVIVVTLVLVPLLARIEAQDAADALKGELRSELLLVPDALTEIIVAGDYASLERYFDHLIGKPHLSNVHFLERGGALLERRKNPKQEVTPGWFSILLGLEPVQGSTPITVGGVNYGELGLTLTPQVMAEKAWVRVKWQLGALSMIMLALLAMLWWVQQQALAPLAELRTAVELLASGEQEHAISEAGSLEVRALIRAYNQMALSLHEAHESWQFFKILGEQSLDPAYAMDYDDDCRFIWINAAAARHFGLPVAEVLKTRLADWDPEFAATRVETFRAQQRTQDMPPFETTHQLRNGQRVAVEVVSKLVLYRGHEYALGHFRDISERKRQADELRAARDAAEAGNRAKSEFLANMSHEIRTPMNGVLGMAQLLMNEPLTAEQKEQVAVMLNSAESLLGLINDILDLSRIEAGQFGLHYESFMPRQMVREIEELLGPGAHGKGLRLRVEIDALLPEAVLGDALRLRQILINLLGNAIKFTAAGEISLRADYLPASSGPGKMCWQVTDSGIGMAPATLARLFQPFTQGDGSITRRYGGSGLGLSITKRLVELMGGRIEARSVEGEGTTFMVTLPCLPGEPAGTRDEPADLPLLPAGLRVLLVEDNPINQKVAQAMLQRSGCVVETAAQGEIALTLLAAESFDIVLMDCQMPVLDGYETTRRIRNGAAGEAARVIPIIAMTANAMAGDREACLNAGMDDYLSKPVQETELRARLSAHAKAAA